MSGILITRTVKRGSKKLMVGLLKKSVAIFNHITKYGVKSYASALKWYRSADKVYNNNF